MKGPLSAGLILLNFFQLAILFRFLLLSLLPISLSLSVLFLCPFLFLFYFYSAFSFSPLLLFRFLFLSIIAISLSLSLLFLFPFVSLLYSQSFFMVPSLLDLLSYFRSLFLPIPLSLNPTFDLIPPTFLSFSIPLLILYLLSHSHPLSVSSSLIFAFVFRRVLNFLLFLYSHPLSFSKISPLSISFSITLFLSLRHHLTLYKQTLASTNRYDI